MPPSLRGDERIKIPNQIKCLDRRDKPAATPHIGREQRELVSARQSREHRYEFPGDD